MSKDEVRTVRWELQPGQIGSWGRGGAKAMNETVWMCDQMRAGQVYSRQIFDTWEQAAEFQRRMLQVEPDAMFDVRKIEARQVWN